MHGTATATHTAYIDHNLNLSKKNLLPWSVVRLLVQLLIRLYKLRTKLKSKVSCFISSSSFLFFLQFLLCARFFITYFFILCVIALCVPVEAIFVFIYLHSSLYFTVLHLLCLAFFSFPVLSLIVLFHANYELY